MARFPRGAFYPIIVILFAAFYLLAQLDRTAPLVKGQASIIGNPNPNVPLAALITFESTEPAIATIEFNGSGVIYRPEQQAALSHTIPVVGLSPAMTHSIRIGLTDASGNANPSAAQLQFETPPLPGWFPPLHISVVDERLMEPGFTLFNVTPISPPAYGLIAAVNNRGQVVWYYRTDRAIGHVSQTARGTMLFLESTDAVEIDVLGNALARWHATGAGIPAQPGNHIRVATNLFHHEILEVPGQTLVTLSHELRRVESFPSSETDPKAPHAPATLVGDTIVEFSRAGQIIREWSLLDLLDTQRIGYDALSSFWDSTYRERYGPTRDWSHANSVSYDARDDAFLVSMRSQDAIAKVGRSDGRLLWLFGVPGGWRDPWSSKLFRADSAMKWPYHQHAATLTPRGSLLMFDNGNHQSRPFSPKQPEESSFSRAVEYALDETALTASEVWSYGGPGEDMFFSGTLGGAQMLASSGNVLITDGARATGQNRWARIVEVTRTKPSRKVFELTVGDRDSSGRGGWSVYRGTRITNLYR